MLSHYEFERQHADILDFDQWLDTEEGEAWLDSEAERYDSDASFGWPWE